MPKYLKPKSGEWVQPKMFGYRTACCDCGLVHTLKFRVIKNKVQFQCFRNNRSTGQVRRHFKSIKVIKPEESWGN